MDVDDKMKKADNILPEDILTDGLPRILPPSEDGVFQAMLTLPEARIALEDMVESVLNFPIMTVILRKNEAPSRDIRAKQERYDVSCVVNSLEGDQCNIEMQASPMKGDNLENEHRNIRWRSILDLCDLHANQEGKGIWYGHYMRSYQVILCNFRVFRENRKLVDIYTFRNPEGQELCDAVTVIFIDLSQAKRIAKKPVSEMTRIERWVVFIALGNQPKYSAIIKEIIKQQEGIAVANEVLMSISQNPDERARFLSRRKWLRDREHDHAVSRDEGIQIGIQETRAEYEPLLAAKDAKLAGKDAEIADKDAEIKALRALLEARQ